MTATAALELQSVTSGYGRSTILRDVNLTVESGGVTALLGANGAGKTMTLSTASGLIRPQRGKVVLDGTVRFGVNRAKVHCFAGDTGMSLAYA